MLETSTITPTFGCTTDRPPVVLSCLKSINSLPLDLCDGLFSHYPAMKMGIASAVSFYADKLYDKIVALIEDTPQCARWVITGPPLKFTPSGANLMAWQVFKKFQNSDKYADRVSLVDLKLPRSPMVIDDAKDFADSHNYCSKDVAQRIKQREQEYAQGDDIQARSAVFKDRGVIVINDIRVTGTQQHFMQKSFDQVPLTCLHWLYIFAVDEPLGQAEPQIEAQINFSRLQSLDDFCQLLWTPEIDYTSKCVARLFTYDYDDFATLVNPLSDQRLRYIIASANAEGRYEGEYFKDKFALLQQLCQSE